MLRNVSRGGRFKTHSLQLTIAVQPHCTPRSLSQTSQLVPRLERVLSVVRSSSLLLMESSRPTTPSMRVNKSLVNDVRLCLGVLGTKLHSKIKDEQDFSIAAWGGHERGVSAIQRSLQCSVIVLRNEDIDLSLSGFCVIVFDVPRSVGAHCD